MKNKLLIISFLFCLSALPSLAQNSKRDSLYMDSYLDTVKVSKASQINDYSLLGVTYGVTLSQMYFNPGKSQDWVFTPRYISVMYSHYQKMFDYLPYFGFQIGVAYSREGFAIKTKPETGRPYETVRGAWKTTYDVLEVPFLIQGHFDSPHFRFLVDLGVYGGYRMSITRTGDNVAEELKNSFAEEDRRWDYGIEGGAGFALVFDPIEIHFSVLGRYGLSTLWVPNMYQGQYNKYYYKFANPIDIMATVGIHYQLSKRTGKTSRQLYDEAYEKVYGKKRK